RNKKRSGEYVFCRLQFSYEKRVERYTPTGDAAMSRIEAALLGALERRDAIWYRGVLQERFLLAGKLYKTLLKEVLQEVQAFIAPLRKEVVLTFYPDLSPLNTEEIRLSGGVYKQDIPELEWPPLAKYPAPVAGGKYDLHSYRELSFHWPCCGRWELHQFSPQQLTAYAALLKRIESHLLDRLADAVREV